MLYNAIYPQSFELSRELSSRTALGISSSKLGPCGFQPSSSRARTALYWALVPHRTAPWAVNLSAVSGSISLTVGLLMKPCLKANEASRFEISPNGYNRYRTSDNGNLGPEMKGVTNHFPILSKINPIFIPQQGIRMRMGSTLLHQRHNQPCQIRNMHVTPTTLPSPNLHPMAVLQCLPRQIRNLYATFVTRPSSQPINQRAIHDCRPDMGLGGREVQEEVIDCTFGG